jgi:hypothetical protein
MAGLASWLFPDPPRDLPGRRALKIGLRAVHVVCVAGLAGACLFDVAPAHGAPWVRAALASGVVLLLLDLHESAVFVFQVRGIVVALKLLLLALLPAFGAGAKWVVVALVVVSVVSSHAPGRVRYRLWWGAGRLRATDSKG